jgi:microcystin degradation protein MlrC
MPRIAVGGFAHETNTFSPRPTDIADFEATGLLRGEELLSLRGTRTPTGGFIEAASRNPTIELIPTINAYAVPGGVVTKAAVELIEGEILRRLTEEQPDAVVLSLHGAMVTEESDDGEGKTISRVRQIIGPDVPLIVELDSHANVTTAMVEGANVLLPYNTYPHIDGYERAIEGIELATAMLEGTLKPTSALVRIPMISAPPKEHTGAGIGKAIMERAFAYEAEPGVVNVGVNWGFAYADTPATAASIVVTTNNDPVRARAIAEELAGWIWEQRQEFIPERTTVEEAIHLAMESEAKPVVLADLGDNPGGGTTCDGTALLWGLLDLGAGNSAIGVIVDPEVVDLAFAAGPGAHLSTLLGAKVDELHGYPVPVEAEVLRISDGKFILEGPIGAGAPASLGRTAVLACEGRHGNIVEVIVCERRLQARDLGIFRSQGIEPTKKDILVLKSSVHYRAAFEPIAGKIIEVDTPGLLSIDLNRFDFRRISRPIWPLDPMPSGPLETVGYLAG